MKTNEIYCGDCLEYLREMKEDTVDHVLTSPPYNLGTSVKGEDIYDEYSDNLGQKQYFNWLNEIINHLLRVTTNNILFNIQYVTGNKQAVFELIGKHAKHIKDILIWHKTISKNGSHTAPAISKNQLTHNYEFIIIFNKYNNSRSYDIDFGREGKYKTCFIELQNTGANKESYNISTHKAIMSITLARKLIRDFTKRNEIILDPFMGVGTTALVCKQLGRKYIGFEINSDYCLNAEERIKQEQLNNKEITDDKIISEIQEKKINTEQVNELLDKYKGLITRKQAEDIIRRGDYVNE